MPLRRMVRDVTSFVSGCDLFAAFALRLGVVLIQFAGLDALFAEVTIEHGVTSARCRSRQS